MLRLKVDEPWLSEIISGRKTIEGRSGSRDKFSPYIGTVAEFYSYKQTCQVYIIDVKHYPTIDEYLFQSGWKNVAPHEKSLESTRAAYYGFYDKDGDPEDLIRQKGGYCAIIIKMM